jgi:plastocyanin
MVKKGPDHHGEGLGRREVLECMLWAGTGVLWTVSGGVPHSVGLIGEAAAAESSGFTFLQMSDSHIGFDKAANPDALGTLREAVAKVKAMTAKPSFIIHTGDITHLSKPAEFDNADKVFGETGVRVHWVPGEHDIIDEERGKAYLERYGKGSKGAGWYSFDDHGVHFIGLVNVVDLKGGGLGNLGAEQLAWLEADLKDKQNSTPIVVFAHIPLQVIYKEWGWGTEDGMQALNLLKRFGSVTVLNGHIHQLAQKVEGNMTFHTALSTAFPQPAPGSAPSPGPMLVPADQLRTKLGLSPSPSYRATSRSPSSTRRWPADRGSSMQTLMKYLRLTSLRFTPGRAVVAAMLLGPAVGALLAFGAVAAQEENVVTIDNFTFTAPELTVALGTTVKWVNHDDIPHTVVEKNKAFRSKALDTDDAYSFTFASAGTFDYFCGLHPHMVGKIIVK